MSYSSHALPLTLLIDLAQNRSDEATRRLGPLQQKQLNAAERLALLRDYRQDYLAQLNTRMRSGLPLAQLRNYQAFVTTLDGAIEQQAAIVTQAQQGLDAGRRDWQQCRQQLKAYDALARRAAHESQRAEGRRERLLSDERAARQFQRA